MKILPIESILGLLESEEGAKLIEKLFKIFSKEVLTNNLRCGNIVFVADRAIA